MQHTLIIKRGDMINCVLCGNAPCSEVCPKKLNPDKLLRSIWFDGELHAGAILNETKKTCTDCDAPCEKACLRSGLVPIKKLLNRLQNEIIPILDTPIPTNEDRLKTDFCGIPLENPFFLSSSVVASNYDTCARAFDAGWAGVSFKTICNFEIHETSPRFAAIRAESGSIVGFKNIEQLSDHSVEENMEVFRQLKRDYPKKFILASIMGTNDEEWERLAKTCEDNGADAIELNFSCPNMMDGNLGSAIGECPDLVERFTSASKKGVSIPVLAKLTPNVSSMNMMAEAAKRGGADGIAAINTIKSIMQIDTETYFSAPTVKNMSAVGGYSGNAVKPIALRFIAELGINPNIKGMYISGMGGIETWKDALEFMLLGSHSVQVTTAVMQYGYRIIDDLKAGLNYYLHKKGFNNVNDIVGLSLPYISDTTDILERDTIIYPKFNRKTCIGCGRCQISCSDGGHQAIRMENSRPILNPKKCLGCHLCVLVCPTHSITSSEKRVTKK